MTNVLAMKATRVRIKLAAKFGARLRSFFPVLGAAAITVTGASPGLCADFSHDVIYQIVTDRFFNGDKTNDDPPQSKGMFDAEHKNWQAYWGGDLAGIKAKLPYLANMGITAIWISPALDNCNAVIKDADGQPTAPYHGYHTRDFMRIEEHFGDAGNSFKAFDELVAAAHAKGIKVIVDFSPNHSNQLGGGEDGALFNNGKAMASFRNDTEKYFHHNPPCKDWNDPYQLQYDQIFTLADLDQCHPTLDRYLKDAAERLAFHKIDAFRLDAIKHVTWGWLPSLYNELVSNHDTFVFGEWFDPDPNSPLFPDASHLSNTSGMSLLDFPFSTAIRTVLGGPQENSFDTIESILVKENGAFRNPRRLVTFIDNHDITRFLTVNKNRNRLHMALALLMTARGIPCILYGTEQYLHDDTKGGNDPYDRPMMTEFNEDTTAYKIIQKLAELKKTNDAMAYGVMKMLYKTDQVYVFERRFADKLVVVAINKADYKPFTLPELRTSLPAGLHLDVLAKLIDGINLPVETYQHGGGTISRPVNLPPHSVSVWQAMLAHEGPAVGNIEPPVAQPGVHVKIYGTGFGDQRSAVEFDGKPAQVLKWSPMEITAIVPQCDPGHCYFEVIDILKSHSQRFEFNVLQNHLVPVTFTVKDIPPLAEGDRIYLNGDGQELGEWKTEPHAAQGPLLETEKNSRFLTVSLPAGASLSYRFFKLAKDGTVSAEGSKHSFKVGSSGPTVETVSWSK